MTDQLTKYEQAELLQNLLVAQATSGDATNEEYKALRSVFINDPLVKHLVPRFVVKCRDLGQFWQFIKFKFSTYQERRLYLWDEFSPLLSALEGVNSFPVDHSPQLINEQYIQDIWNKALERRFSEPEGAITLARTLLETVCKHILDNLQLEYDEASELPKLYKMVAESLNLAPSHHNEEIFKQILGGCQSVVQGLGALRNKLSDSHGRSKSFPKPGPRHAQLAVNLAGGMAAFILATFEESKS